MLIELDNFGIIDSAKIEMNQINIIGGVNSSGKSTCSKVLYSFLTSVSPEGNYLANKSINEKLLPLILIFKNIFEDNLEIRQELDSLISINDYEVVFDKLVDIYNNNDFENKENIANNLNNIKKIMDINESNDKYAHIINVLLDSEFNLNQLQNDSKIRFSGDNFEYCLEFSKDKLKGNVKYGDLNSLVFNQAVYIDSLSVLDYYKNISMDSFEISFNNRIPFHIQDLSRKLKSEKKLDVYGNEFCKDILNLIEDLETLISGKIEFNYQRDEFVYKNKNITYSMNNTASGIKQIGILQLLLDKSILKNNSFVFIDEPEINLHPEWQVNFAKFIVLLAKNSNISFYINSHSPFFIEAIEVYSEFYNMNNKTNYYLSEKSLKEGMYNINQIEVDNLYKIYNNLGNPFNLINKIRFMNENKKEAKCFFTLN